MKTNRSLVFLVTFTISVSAVFSQIFADASEPEVDSKPSISSDKIAFKEGYKLLKQKKYAQAQKRFEEAIAIRYKFPEAHNNLAYVLRKQSADNFKLAEKHYNIALSQNPNLAQAYAYRGTLYTLQGEIEKAETDYAKLLTLDNKLALQLRKVIDEKSDKTASGSFGVSTTNDALGY